MKKDLILLDGAFGTCLWKKAQEKGCPREPVWKYNIDCPQIVEALTREYIAAGAQLVQANTFGANGMAAAREKGYRVDEAVAAGVRIAKEAAAGTGVQVALSAGPLPMMLEPFGDLTEEQARKIFEEQLGAGAAAGADCIVLETFLDAEMLAVAVGAAKQYGLPVLTSMTFEKSGRTMMGQSVEDVLEILAPLGVDAVGINCSLGPEQALPILRRFAELTELPLIFKPNAGLPVQSGDGTEISACGAEEFAEKVRPAFPLVSYLGGCCGTDPDYIRAIGRLLRAEQ